jgi:DNA polymerase I
MSRTPLYILDVSGFIFRAYYALPHMAAPSGESTHALYGFIRSWHKFIKDFAPERCVAVFDGPDNKRGRQALYAEYKSNRTEKVEDLPHQIECSQEFCQLMGIPFYEIEGVEADDTIGSIAQWEKERGGQVFILTSDKDLCQLVDQNVMLIHPWKNNMVMDKEAVKERFGVWPHQIIDLLAMMGDTSDNIPGIKGFGPKTAVSLLEEFGSLEEILAHPEKVKGAKKQQTLKEEAETARLSQRLATIDLDLPFEKPDQDFELQTPNLSELRNFYLSKGFNSLVKELEVSLEQTEEKVSYTLIESEKQLKELEELLQSEKECCFDVESTSLAAMEALPVGIGFCFTPKIAYYLPFNGPFPADKLIERLKPLFLRGKFIAHNGKYDAHVLANVGICIPHIVFDTILASALLESGEGRHSLDALSLKHFGKVKTSIKELIGTGKKTVTMDEVPLQKVSDYCCEDVDYTMRLKELFAKQLARSPLSALLYDIEIPLMHVLMKMERHGVFVDRSRLKDLSKRLQKECDQIKQEVFDLAGEEFNLNSPKQLSEILFDKLGIKPLKKTITGFSTKAEVLEALALEHPIAEKILVFRTVDKLLSTYVLTLPEQIHPITERIHPTFNQFVTATGRLACQDPNLQNIPVRTELGKEIRSAFRPQKMGWVYLSADYSQIELRLLAHMSEDPTLIKAFKEGIDIHRDTASRMFGVPMEKVTPVQRHQAKAINFGIIYGQQAYGLSQELKIERKQAAEFIDEYFKLYPKIAHFIENSIESARKDEKAVTMIGRERKIPDINSKNAIARNAAERLAVNTPLQGSQADMIKLAMLKIDQEMSKKGMKAFCILQVHDELIFECPDEEIETLQELVVRHMSQGMSLKVPIVVDVHVGKNWGEC